MAIFVREYLLVGFGRIGRIGPFKHRIGTGIGLLLSLVCLALGQWQVCRLGQKNHLQLMIDRAYGAPAAPLVLPTGLPMVRDDGRHLSSVRQDRAIFFDGIWEWDLALALTPRMHRGKLGYHLLVPVWMPSHGVRILVNAGWMPQGAPIPTPHGDGVTFPRDGEGYVRLPSKKSLFTPDSTWSTGTVYGIDLTQIAAHLDKKIGKKSSLRTDFYVVLRRPLNGVKQSPIPEGGRMVLTNNHLSYSLTWHALALVFFVMTMIEWRKRRQTLHKEDNHHDR